MVSGPWVFKVSFTVVFEISYTAVLLLVVLPHHSRFACFPYSSRMQRSSRLRSPVRIRRLRLSCRQLNVVDKGILSISMDFAFDYVSHSLPTPPLAWFSQIM